jgi:Tfp pilus assembly protein PilO
MKMILSEREKWLLFGSAVAVAYYFFSTFLFLPKMAEIDSLKERIRISQQDLKTSQDKAKVLEKLEVTPLEKLRQKKNKEEQVIDALQYISREVSKLRLNMLSIRPRMEERTVDLAKAVFIDLSFSGRYNDIYKFMSALEKLPILILVDSMEMTKSKTGSDVKVTMILSVYY